MNIIQIVLPIFLIIALGAFLGKIKKLNLDPYVFIIMYITAPALIISSLQKSEIQLKEFSLMALYTAIIVVSLWLLSTLTLKFLKTKQKGIQLPMIFGNSGYLGFPVTLFAFGVLGLSYAVIYSSIETIFLMSLGIFLANHKNDIKEIFKIPLIYAIIFALILNIINFKLPEVILIPIDMVGQITIPLALIVLGYRLTKIKIKDAKKAFLASLFKMGIGLLFAILLSMMFGISGTMKSVLILIASMPSAVLTMVICHQYKRDTDLVASVILISTLLSIITIPLILLFL